MRIAVVGAGPAGLYAATLLRRARPRWTVDVFERNPPDATFGFGVVFSDTALDFLERDDPDTHALIAPHMETWRDLALVHRGTKVAIDGVGFSAIGRLAFLQLLQQRACESGVEARYDSPVADTTALDGYDLIIGADGVNSVVRMSAKAGFGTETGHLDNRFIWYGAERAFDTLTQTFIATDRGCFNAHHYRYAPGLSTFIVETDPVSWQAHGFAEMDETETRETCERIFAATLGGARLVSNQSCWRQFPLIVNRHWSSGNRVLIGDALHTAHFSIGSGTRLAMEDAIALAHSLCRHDEDVPAALVAFEARRRPAVDKLVAAATRSGRWYDRFADHMRLAPHDLAMAYIRRSGRVDDDRLAAMAPRFMAAWREHRAS